MEQVCKVSILYQVYQDAVGYTTIKIRTETKKRLMQIAGELEAARGEEVSLNEVIEHLIENYRTRSRKPLNLADLDHLAVELEEDASEKIDDILYRKSRH
ncbi:hypothetical protein P186_0819 [Pyrobaculum ferrireducens]|uniref:Uncharacterized protein n=1 Tax=Pyrobaculum ferrireducens TaxID=1104324 RepID=G7VAM4_9CREN|nr:hypothetical protein P186_0819 [Pyrobaculum ferrireducens]